MPAGVVTFNKKFMGISKELLQRASDTGSQEASRAFSKLSGEDVKVTVSVAELLSYGFLAESIKPKEEKAVITYTQTIEGMKGIAILTIGREEALALVDLLNKRDVGTTGVLLDLDRSAIKETLNIISNAFLNALAKLTKQSLIIGLPYMMTASHIQQVIHRLKKESVGKGESAVVFKTFLEISKHKIEAQLYVIFDQNIVDILKK